MDCFHILVLLLLCRRATPGFWKSSCNKNPKYKSKYISYKCFTICLSLWRWIILVYGLLGSKNLISNFVRRTKAHYTFECLINLLILYYHRVFNIPKWRNLSKEKSLILFFFPFPQCFRIADFQKNHSWDCTH